MFAILPTRRNTDHDEAMHPPQNDKLRQWQAMSCEEQITLWAFACKIPYRDIWLFSSALPGCQVRSVTTIQRQLHAWFDGRIPKLKRTNREPVLFPAYQEYMDNLCKQAGLSGNTWATANLVQIPPYGTQQPATTSSDVNNDTNTIPGEFNTVLQPQGHADLTPDIWNPYNAHQYEIFQGQYAAIPETPQTQHSHFTNQRAQPASCYAQPNPPNGYGSLLTGNSQAQPHPFIPKLGHASTGSLNDFNPLHAPTQQLFSADQLVTTGSSGRMQSGVQSNLRPNLQYPGSAPGIYSGYIAEQAPYSEPRHRPPGI